MPKRLTYEYIKSMFEQENYILISNTYTNARAKLEYICPEGHRHSGNWDHFQRGYRCPTCAGNIKHTLDFVKSAFEEEGYEVLSTEYTGSGDRLDCICSEGHTCNISWDNFNQGKRCKTCAIIRRTGVCNCNWEGGVTKIPLYKTYAPQLSKYMAVYKIEQGDLELLGIECLYCKTVFTPSRKAVGTKLDSMRGKCRGENNFYCSEECKEACPIYGRHKYPKGENPNKNNRPLQNQWASMVKKRDNYTCQKCGAKNKVMYAHHIDPVINNPIESADIDNGITLCKKCDKLAHKIIGCTLNDLRC